MAASVPTLHSNAWTQSQGLNRWAMSGAENSLRLQVKTWNSCHESLDPIQWLQSAKKFKYYLWQTLLVSERRILVEVRLIKARAYFIAKLWPKLSCSRCLLIHHDLKERWICLPEAFGCHAQGDITFYMKLFLRQTFIFANDLVSSLPVYPGFIFALCLLDVFLVTLYCCSCKKKKNQHTIAKIEKIDFLHLPKRRNCGDVAGEFPILWEKLARSL